MSEVRFLQLATEASYVALAVGAILAAVRWPERARVDIALFFGALGLAVAMQELPRVTGGELPGGARLASVLIVALPYLLVRLVDNFHDVSPRARVGVLATGVLLSAALLAIPQPLPPWLVAVALAYLIGGVLYAAWTFVFRARLTAGITSRRMWAAASGCGLLAMVFGLAMVTAAVPAAAPMLALLSQLAALASGLSFMAAFVPPPFLRQAWRLPDLFAYLRTSRDHPDPRLSGDESPQSGELLETASIERALASLSRIIGARRALLWLREDDGASLSLWSAPSTRVAVQGSLLGSAFTSGRPRFVRRLAPAAMPPEVWELFASEAVPRSAMVAPVTARGEVLGVVLALADKGPIFVTDDLDILSFFAGEIGLVLEGRRLRETTQELAALREADRLKDEFMAVVSHELRTPLTAISGYADILLRQMSGPLNDRQERQVLGVRDAARRLLALINDLLDVSKLEAGTIDLHVAPVDPQAAVLRAMTGIRVLAAGKEITIQRRSPAADDPGLPVLADEDRLQQILVNLLANAVKFTPQRGAITLGAATTIGSNGPVVVFEVADTGVGIARDQLGRVWDRFYQGESSSTRRFGGTGLGLSIVKRLTELHGGTVDVSSPGPDRGSTFRVSLPAASAVQAAPDLAGGPTVGALVSRSMPESEPPARAADGRPTVLVVEDDPDIASVLETYLDREGYDVAHASDGQEALRLAHAVRPFAITLDVMLPKLDGWSVLNALKRDPEVARIPVVVISIVDNRTFGMVLGATDYLVKPIDPEQFRTVLHRLAGHPRPGQDCLLVVDDDPEIRDVLGTTLAAEGWQVVTAAGGREALELVAREHPRAMLLDLMMPDVDGFDVLRALRQDPRTTSLPVVVVTAKELTDEERRRLSGAAERVIVKQSTPIDKLGEQVRNALAAHAAHRA